MGAVVESGIGSGDRYRRGAKELEELLSKLNPSAKEFVPSSYSASPPQPPTCRKLESQLSADAPVFVASVDWSFSNLTINGGLKDFSSEELLKNQQHRRSGNGYTQRWRRFNVKVKKAQKEEYIRRTIYVSDIDQHVTEEQLAALFNNCGQVIDCRICGDLRSVFRFAFIEFADEYSAKAALYLQGTVLGYCPVSVLPSKTAILPVNPTFLPRSADEREMCSRTVYCTNIDKKVSQTDLRDLFETYCGKVSRLRLLGDYSHSAHIAFVEFSQAESAIKALTCSGMLIGALPIRVSPSKTPVRTHTLEATSE